MATFTKSITGRVFKITPNHSKRTFTIQSDGTKYRTNPMSREEFNSCLNNTGNDWQQFLKSNDYYVVR